MICGWQIIKKDEKIAYWNSYKSYEVWTGKKTLVIVWFGCNSGNATCNLIMLGK